MEQRIPTDFGVKPKIRLDTPKTAGIQPSICEKSQQNLWLYPQKAVLLKGVIAIYNSIRLWYTTAKAQGALK